MYNSPLERDIYTQTKYKSDIYFDEVSDWVPDSETGFQFNRDSSYIQYYRKDIYPCTRLNLSTRGEAAITIDRAQNIKRV
jgi:hypothetical protein